MFDTRNFLVKISKIFGTYPQRTPPRAGCIFSTKRKMRRIAFSNSQHFYDLMFPQEVVFYHPAMLPYRRLNLSKKIIPRISWTRSLMFRPHQALRHRARRRIPSWRGCG